MNRRILPALPYPIATLVLSDTCPNCGVYSRFTHRANTESKGRVGSVFVCESCFSFLYVEWELHTTNANNPNVTNPKYVSLSLPEADLTYVPGTVKKDFNEARTCYGATCYNAFASMCRRTIQSIFTDKGAEGKSKVEKQFASFKEEYSDQEANEILEELIKAGHDGAHPHLPEVTEPRATLMLRLMNDLLDQLYNRPGRIAEAGKKRAAEIGKVQK